MPCQRACSSSFFPFWARSGPDSSHLQLQGPAQIGQAQQDGQALSVAVQPPMTQLGIAKDLLDPAKGKLHIGPHPSLAPFRRVGGALPVNLEAAVRPDCHLPVQGKDPAARDAVRSPDSLHCRTPCTPGSAVDGGSCWRSWTRAAVACSLCTRPLSASTPICIFIPQGHRLPFLVECLSESRACR